MALDETTDWDALRLMRGHGKKPALPVIVTTHPRLPQRLHGVGCLTILHKAGEVMPIRLLDGLDVIFFFERCDMVIGVQQLAKAKGVKFGWAKTWCSCAGLLSIAPFTCESHAEAEKWMGTGRAT
jgi:hypothetical protein